MMTIIDFDQYRFGYTGTTNPEASHGKGKMVWKTTLPMKGTGSMGGRGGASHVSLRRH